MDMLFRKYDFKRKERFLKIYNSDYASETNLSEKEMRLKVKVLKIATKLIPL